jgi:hypothetical protein
MASNSKTSRTKKPQKKPARNKLPEKLRFTIEVERGTKTGKELSQIYRGYFHAETVFDYVAVKCINSDEDGVLRTLAIYDEKTKDYEGEIKEYSKRQWEYIKLYIGQAMLDASGDLIDESSLFANPNVDLNRELDGSLDLHAMGNHRTPHSVTTAFQGQVAYLAQQKEMRLMGWDDRMIKPGRKGSINSTAVLRAMRMYFADCFAACEEIRNLGSLLARQAKAEKLDMPKEILSALNKKERPYIDSLGRKKESFSYSPRQVAYVWAMWKDGIRLPMSSKSSKAIERMVKSIGSPAGYHNVRVIVRTPNSR